MRLFHHCKFCAHFHAPILHCKCAHILTAKIETVAYFTTQMRARFDYNDGNGAPILPPQMRARFDYNDGNVRLFYHYKWVHISATRTSNRTSSLQVSTFPPTVSPRPGLSTELFTYLRIYRTTFI